MLKQCPRCFNSEIVAEANFYKICGLKLPEAEKLRVIMLHKDLSKEEEQNIRDYMEYLKQKKGGEKNGTKG